MPPTYPMPTKMPSPSRTRSGKALIQPAADPEAVLSEIRRLITHRPDRARRLAAEAVIRFPEHARIRSANSVLNDPQQPMEKTPPEPPTDEEFEWLKNAPDAVRGKWVALSGSELLVADEELKSLMANLRTEYPDRRALVHYIEQV